MSVPEPPLFKTAVRWHCPTCHRRLREAARGSCSTCGPVEATRFEYQQWIGGSRPAHRWALGRG